jgi:hypothetical protein
MNLYYLTIRGVKGGVLTVRFRNLRPQSRGTLAAAVPHVKGNDLAAPGIHSDPDPLRIRFLLHEAAHFIGFHLQALNHDVAAAGDRLDVEMIRQCLNALDQKAQEPLELNLRSAINAT